MRFAFALCSMILLFSITGLQAQTDSVLVPGDSLQSPATAAPGAPEVNVPKTTPAIPVQNTKADNSLTGVKLFSCNGLYFYNKSTEKESDYEWVNGSYQEVEYDVTYTTSMYAILFNVSYMAFNGFSIGGTLGVLAASYERETDHQDPFYFNDDSHGTSVNIFGPRLAYYYGKKDSKIMPFASFEFDILTSDFYSDNATRIGAGVLFQPKPHLGISFGLDYLKLGKEEKTTNIMGVLGLTGILY